MLKTIAFAAALTLAVFAASGCKPQGGDVAMRPVAKNATPDSMVKNAVETRASLTSLAGNGVMRIVDQPTRFGLTVNANVVADESERLRIRADKLAGSIQAFDVVMLKDDIGFYVPTQKTLYHGKVNELRNFAFRFDPDEVLRQMLRPDTALLLKRWRYAEPRKDDPQNSVALEEEAPAGRPRMRLAISKSNGMILSAAQLDGAGNPYLVKRYDDYRRLTRGRNMPKGSADPVFPYLIAFSWPRDRRSMEMHFKSVDGNAVVTDADFDLATSSDTRFRPLGEANVDADAM